jgi:hypothetical protein
LFGNGWTAICLTPSQNPWDKPPASAFQHSIGETQKAEICIFYCKTAVKFTVENHLCAPQLLKDDLNFCKYVTVLLPPSFHSILVVWVWNLYCTSNS